MGMPQLLTLLQLVGTVYGLGLFSDVKVTMTIYNHKIVCTMLIRKGCITPNAYMLRIPSSNLLKTREKKSKR